MTRCLDIHTHHLPPQPEGVVCATPDRFHPVDNQYFSIGIHPWKTTVEPTPEEWNKLEELASDSRIVAIGECGVDTLKGGPLFRQMIVMKRHIEISERFLKPLVIHDVKAHEIIIGLKKELKPTQKWVVHGFRGKPTVAKMLTDAGIYLSFGEKFNSETLMNVAEEMILAETDESHLTIEQIIFQISSVKGYDMTPIIGRNTSLFLGGLN
ncbi:MAG: TatD family hydrolase [Muribaculaceae bacterium]|nr:TatD family hydrolase [Muribaculaceae bacterium]